MKQQLTIIVLIGLAAPAAAQQTGGGSGGVATQGISTTSQDASSDVPDRGGLTSRGGASLQSQKTFQATIGTSIYTPIGTSMYTPVQQPPNSASPQS